MMIAGVCKDMSFERIHTERVLSPRLKWRCPGQPHLGTRVDNYRCSLPGLAEFTIYRCEGTVRATTKLPQRRAPKLWLNRFAHARKKESNLPVRVRRTMFTLTC